MTKKQYLGDFVAPGAGNLQHASSIKARHCYCLSVGNVTQTPLKL